MKTSAVLARGGLTLALVLHAPLLPGQAVRPAAPAAGYRIAGTVVNAVTGEPVHHATMSLADPGRSDTRESVEADDDGRFVIDKLGPGKYGLRAAHRGYRTSFFNEHDEFSSAIVTGEGQDTEHILFKLSPDAMVHGVVTDDAGEPVQNARVFLARKARNGGLGEHLARSISGNTDDLGSFEFWNLLPGTYFLAVKADPWFALHPFVAGHADSNSSTAALDVTYPITFFDGTTDQAGATPIPVASGDRVELNVSLHAVPAVHLMVRNPSLADDHTGPNNRILFPVLRESILGQDEQASSAGVRAGPPGSGLLELTGIAPGHYELEQGDPPKLVEIDATGNQEVDPTGGTSTYSVTARVAMADGSPSPGGMELLLESDSNQRRELRAMAAPPVAGKWSGRFESVPPGTWNVVARAPGALLSAISIQSGGSIRGGSEIQVKDRSLALSITLAPGATSVEGFALKDGKPVPGIMVVLVPKDPGANRTLFRRDQSDSDGSFFLRDAVPGAYTAVAIEDGWELDWARPDVIGRYLSKGIPVTLNSKSGKLTSLPTPVPVQPR